MHIQGQCRAPKILGETGFEEAAMNENMRAVPPPSKGPCDAAAAAVAAAVTQRIWARDPVGITALLAFVACFVVQSKFICGTAFLV